VDHKIKNIRKTEMLGYILTLMVGTFFGMFIMALLLISKQSDEELKQIMDKENVR